MYLLTSFRSVNDVTGAIARPLFLHFLNRELAESVMTTITSDRVETSVKVILAGTTAWLYTGLSLLWESAAANGYCLYFLGDLIAQDVLEVVSHTQSLDDFLSSRQSRYRFDRHRYPMYFDRCALMARSALVPSSIKPTSATSVIDKHVRSWAEFGIPGIKHNISPRLSNRVTSSLITAIDARADRAITGALVTPSLPRLPRVASIGPHIRRQLALAFTTDYIDTMGGDIPTGISGLSICDHLAKSFPVFDVPLLRLVLELLGASRCVAPGPADDIWQSIRLWRNTEAHSRFSVQISNVLGVIYRMTGGTAVPPLESRARIAYALRSCALPNPVPYSPTSVEPLWLNMNYLVRSLGRLQGFAREYERMSADATARPCDILLITATDVETAAVLRQAGTDGQVVHGKLRSYRELGNFGGSRLALVQCEAGSVSPGSSLPTALFAIDELRPIAVILLGIAFGMDRRTQEIGQVLVSRQLELYEPARVGVSPSLKSVTRHRGDRATASPRLISRFRAHSATSNLKSTFGLIVSGEKLLDNPRILNELRRAYPEAIGGEMEGAGLYSAARERSVEWIVVKAICDWADGTKGVRKRERQTLAASNAAMFVLSCIESGGYEAGGLLS